MWSEKREGHWLGAETEDLSGVELWAETNKIEHFGGTSTGD